jgi:hypothetical protein
MNPDSTAMPATIYWHRELPPLEAQPMEEHVVEATSRRVPDTIAHRDDFVESVRNRAEGKRSRAPSRRDRSSGRSLCSCAR